MAKRIISIILVGIMMIAMLSACGNKDSKETEKATEATQAETKAEETEAEETKAEETKAEETKAEETKAEETEAEETEEADKYAEKISFSVTTYYSIYKAATGYDLTEDPYIQWVFDKFNVDIDAWTGDSATANDSNRTWLQTGTAPDLCTWTTYSAAEMAEYADQGLIKALPEGWEEKWPNLAKMIKSSGMSELVKFDGLTYVIPHAVFGNFNEMDPFVSHPSVHFRKDWAEKVGMSDLGEDGTITLAELEEYLKKVEEAGLCANSVLGDDISQLSLMFGLVYGISNQKFNENEDGFYWVYDDPAYEDSLLKMKEWINNGLIDADYYTKTAKDYWADYQAGLIPAIFYSCGCGDIQTAIEGMMTNDGYTKDNIEEYNKARTEYEDRIGCASIAADDGTVYAYGGYSYWLVSVFSPECDDATQERILDMIDWFCTDEGQLSERLAIPGEDFTVENKQVTVLNEDIISGEYQVSPSRFFNAWGYCGDDIIYATGMPGRYEHDQQLALKLYAVKQAGTVLSVSDAVTAFAGEEMKNYSFDANAAIAQALAADDVVAEWTKIKEDNEAIWKPVVDALNAQ